MLDGISLTDVSDFSGITGLVVMALLVITRRLVWHSDLRREEARTERYEAMVWKLAGVAQGAVTVVEKTVTDDGPSGVGDGS